MRPECECHDDDDGGSVEVVESVHEVVVEGGLEALEEGVHEEHDCRIVLAHQGQGSVKALEITEYQLLARAKHLERIREQMFYNTTERDKTFAIVARLLSYVAQRTSDKHICSDKKFGDSGTVFLRKR